MTITRHDLRWTGKRLFRKRSGQPLAQLFQDKHDKTLWAFSTRDGYTSDWKPLDAIKREAMDRVCAILNKQDAAE